MSKSIGLIGCGRWGKNILRDLCALKAKITVVDSSEKIRMDVLKMGAMGAYSSITEHLEQMDGFVVATPTVSHAEVIDQLLIFNKPIFVEKPLTCHLDFAHHLAKTNRHNIFIMDKWRYHAGIKIMAEKIRAGLLGKLQAIRTYRLGWGHVHDDVDPIWILLPHDLSIVLHLLGELPPVKSVTSIVAAHPSAGMLIVLEGERTPKVIIEMSTLYPINKRSVVVMGERGSIQLADANADQLVYCKRDESVNKDSEHIPIESTPPLFDELKSFLHYLQGGPEPKSSLKEGVLIVEKIAEIRETLFLS